MGFGRFGLFYYRMRFDEKFLSFLSLIPDFVKNMGM